MRLRFPRLTGFALLALLLCLPQTARAQRRLQRPRFGGVLTIVPAAGLRGGYDFDGEAWSAGGQAVIPLTAAFGFEPSADIFFPTGRTRWQLNADALVHVPTAPGIYAGGGGLSYGNHAQLDRTIDTHFSDPARLAGRFGA